MDTYIHTQVHTQMHIEMSIISQNTKISFLIIKYCQHVDKRLTDWPSITVLGPTFVSMYPG